MSEFEQYKNELLKSIKEDAQRSMRDISNQEKGVFIDCGSNLGQGFEEFSRYYPISIYDYILIEPNPYCWPELEIKIKKTNNIQLIKAAASTSNGKVSLYGLEHGITSQGASILHTHNSKYYTPINQNAIEVDCFSLSDMVEKLSANYKQIIIKMDIEGAEYDVLNNMIETKKIEKIKHLYIEFHSQYMSDNDRQSYIEKEINIMHRLQALQIPFTLWI